VAKLVYIDETGLNERGAGRQQYATLASIIITEDTVKPLRDSLRRIASQSLDVLPNDFEFHAYDIWNGRGIWSALEPAARLDVLKSVVGLLDEHDITVSHSTIDKPKLHARYGGRADSNVYLLALQFLLEKIDALSENKIIIADEAKEHELKAVRMLSDMQDWGSGEVPSRQLRTIIDSLHYVKSHQSPGVQMADTIAYILQRSRLPTQNHPNANAAMEQMKSTVWKHCSTWRQAWPP
jgi:hypothetical protein